MAGAKKSILHWLILIGMVLGGVTGLIAKSVADRNGTFDQLKSFAETWADPIGNTFIAMIFMVVVPLLLSALVLGVAEIGDVAKFGRVGVRTLVMTIVFSGIAVLLAFGAMSVVKPGTWISAEARAQLDAKYTESAQKKLDEWTKKGEEAKSLADPPVFGLVPKNPVLEATRALSGGIIPFMFFALVFGLAMNKVDPDKSAVLKQFFEALFEVCQRIIEMAMKLAPIGVFALVFKSAATLGLEIFKVLGVYALIVVLLLAFHQFVVYSVMVKLVAKRNPIEFFRQMKNVMLTAFSTSSSNATLPVALHDAQHELNLPKDISSFVLTVGATANQNGTALFEGTTLLFLAQLHGIDLAPAQQFSVLGLAIVAGIGTAGVPGGAWPVIAGIVQSLGMKATDIGPVFGIDRILDMSRTVVNVTGDMAIAACVSTWEGKTYEVPEDVME